MLSFVQGRVGIRRLVLICLAVHVGSAAESLGAIPHPEHPRPDFRRREWLNLNGQWLFDFDPKNEGETKEWFKGESHQFTKTITVPFPWEAKLSGVGDTSYKGVAWYAKQVEIPWSWRVTTEDRRVWLRFGAVDFHAKVWVNGRFVGEHIGGYTPFSFDVAPFIEGDAPLFIVLRAEDRTDPAQPTGKQVGWYTRTSGIWQPVWLELTHKTHVRQFKINTDIDASKVTLDVVLADAANGDRIKVSAGGISDEAAVTGNAAKLTLTFDDPHLWSPEDPYLYDADLTVIRDMRPIDRVRTYFGMRQIKVDRAPGRDYRYIYLNNKPVYLRGALHQSFHPDGIYQYPSDEAIRKDYEIAKEAGLNFLRIHIKLDDPRALYYADKLGVMLMCDMPNFWKYGEKSEQWYEQMLREGIDRDYNHPAIIAWCNFNETWGIGDGGYTKPRWDFVSRMYKLTKQLDPTRLVEDNSPCKYDHVETDINSWHFYINEYAAARDHIADVVKKTHSGSPFNFVPDFKQGDQPLINSEYGGISAGAGDQDISWCLKYLTNELRKHPRICGYVYTELSDIEWEHNGLVNYDRTSKEFGYREWFKGFTLKDIFNPIFVVLDAPPCATVKPGQSVEIPVLINYFAHLSDVKHLVRWSVVYDDRFGQRMTGPTGQYEARCEAYDVTAQQPIRATMPQEPCVAALLVELVDDIGRRYAANYVNFHVTPEKTHVMEVLDARRVALRFQPGDFSEWQWSQQEMVLIDQVGSDRISGYGYGKIAYSLRLPEGLPYEDLIKVEIYAEAAAKANGQNLDWPERRNPKDYPQTDNRRFPSDVQLLINGKTVADQTLEDDPADARGVLSHLYKVFPGSYGYPVTGRLSGRSLFPAEQLVHTLTVEFVVAASAVNKGGLTIFGDRTGRYAFDPTLVLEFRGPHGREIGETSDPNIIERRMLTGPKPVLPTATEGKHVWKYTFDQPLAGWIMPEFDDGKWASGQAGFGTPGTPNAVIGTEWKTPDIWLRTRIRIDDIGDVTFAILRLYHDENIEIYINGQQVLSRDGPSNNYMLQGLSTEQRKLLKDGDNVIAVHCRQTGGGQNVDVGLSVVPKDR